MAKLTFDYCIADTIHIELDDHDTATIADFATMHELSLPEAYRFISLTCPNLLHRNIAFYVCGHNATYKNVQLNGQSMDIDFSASEYALLVNGECCNEDE